MNKEEISKIMAIVAVEFSGRFTVTPERVGVWWQILGDYTFQEGQRGVIRAIGNAGQFPPSVGDVRNVLQALRKEDRRQELIRRDSNRMIDHRDPKAIEFGRELLRNCVASLPTMPGGKR